MNTKSGECLLIYAQDPGGARFMAPVINDFLRFWDKEKCIVLTHALSEHIFTDFSIEGGRLEQVMGEPPISVKAWKNFLQAKEVSRVFCSTSSTFRDLTNGHLIQASRDLNVPVLGTMDHWKGGNRFYDRGIPVFMPDWICCIDENAKDMLRKIGFKKSQIHVTGHPYLESLSHRSQNSKTLKGELGILLLSQPYVHDGSFEGIFFKKFGWGRLIERIISCTNEIKTDICIRQHPKEKSVVKLPPEAGWDANPDLNISIDKSGLCIGLDSMALIEAQIRGKYCISLQIPELIENETERIPVKFNQCVSALSELESHVCRAVKELSEGWHEENQNRDFLKDSRTRTIGILNDFLEGII